MRGLARSFLPGRRSTIPAAIVPGGQWSLLPGTHRVKVANIAPRDLNYYATGNTWADLWQAWPWDHATAPIGIKQQIDIAQSVYGANTIRMLGSQAVRTANSFWSGPYISQATYLAQWGQVADYVRSKGMYLYPCLATDTSYSAGVTWTPDISWLTAELVAVSTLMRQYCDIVIGVDQNNEVLSASHTAYNLITMYTTLKAAAPELKFTNSCFNIGDTSSAGGSVDFLDIHDWVNFAASAYDATLAAWGCPVMMGEFGANFPSGSTTRQAAYNAALALTNYSASGRHTAGAGAWSLTPQDSNAAHNDDYGLCDAAGTPRSDVQSIFVSFPS